ncbi:carbamate kinase [Anaeramoeba flamelloides]|uniref:Carbamate kinase n=1 Tax=Anaeramoeba flamelloides TaxID=1746091 RepID=A0AAV7ZH10_9EUKA|nr:carbamate kinase [Anaeramoeba flamelloides]
MSSEKKKPVVVVALGGNALLQRGQKGTIEDQRKNARVACKQIVKLIQSGYNVHVVHGNGPQAGAVFLQNVNSKETIPPNPLDVVVSETQGLIGYVIQQELQNEFDKNGIEKNVATIVTRMEVSADDPAFENPTKPIGKFYTEEEAKELEKDGYCMKEDAGRGWRITTYSPQPLRILESKAIKTLIDNEVVTVSCGGGGIPVVKKRWRNQRAVEKMTVEEAEQYLQEGHFAVGSMYPKVQSAARFVKETQKFAIITSLDKALDALNGKAGTKIVL